MNLQKGCCFAQTKATVYVPNNQRSRFLNKIREYEEKTNRSGKPFHALLLDSISDIRLAVLESFWQDNPDQLPVDDPIWVEIWLSTDTDVDISRFELLLRDRGVERAEGILKFPERSVLLILVTREDLEYIIEASDYIAELRLAKEVASEIVQMDNKGQSELVKDLLERTQFRVEGDVAVLVLDSGVNNGHLILQPVLADEDCHTVDPSWGLDDHHGHGTLMGGTAAYGDLITSLNSGDAVFVNHRLESAKIWPPAPSENPKELWGYMTAQGVSRAEIQAPERKRVVCLAITATDFRDSGRPSSWSAELDRISSGTGNDNRQLVVVSAGNVRDQEEWKVYPSSNISSQVHDPGQSWNALTVGAYTEKVLLVDPSLRNYSPIAPAGGLSPFSSTSTTWPLNKWPIKPDVVFEGGNVARGPNESIQVADELQLLSTYHEPHVAQFAPFNMTSAAAAQAANMAAVIQSRYPESWPETIRGLIVHTAEWTDTMRHQFPPQKPGQPKKSDYARLLKICGYGVPSLDRALYCAANSLTLISQTEIQPYDRRGNQRVTRDMHFYQLPWPLEQLRDLDATEVKMRVTLSYFVEPGPGEVGWQDRYRYPSHLLRFAVNGPEEGEQDFIRRINEQAREDGEHPGTDGPGERWVIGRGARNVGSIHSDIWQGRAIDLAASNLIAVYPAVGWWRERHHLGKVLNQTRYSLLVSIQTPAPSVDIYTPVAIKLGITTPVVIPTS